MGELKTEFGLWLIGKREEGRGKREESSTTQLLNYSTTLLLYYKLTTEN